MSGSYAYHVGDLVNAGSVGGPRPAIITNIQGKDITIRYTAKARGLALVKQAELTPNKDFDWCAGIALDSLQEGSAVEGRYLHGEGGKKWFRGKIAAINSNGTFAISYNDGDYEASVLRENIRTEADRDGRAHVQSSRAIADSAIRTIEQDTIRAIECSDIYFQAHSLRLIELCRSAGSGQRLRSEAADAGICSTDLRPAASFSLRAETVDSADCLRANGLDIGHSQHLQQGPAHINASGRDSSGRLAAAVFDQRRGSGEQWHLRGRDQAAIEHDGWSVPPRVLFKHVQGREVPAAP